MIKELKSFIKHSFIYSLGNLIAKALGFFFIPIYTRYLTPKDYGILELLELTATIISMFLGMRIGVAIIRFYYDFEKEIEKQELIGTSLLILLFIALLIIIFSQLFSREISFLIFDTYIYGKFFKIVFLYTALSLIASVSESYLIARKQSFLYTIVTLSTLVSYITFNIYFIIFRKLGVLGILYSSLITKALNSSSLTIYCILKNKLRFSFQKLVYILKFSLPLIPAAFGVFILNYADRFILQKFVNTSSVGIYSLAYKFAYMLPFLVLQPIQMILTPQMFEISQKKEGIEIISKMFTYVFLIICFASLVISIFAKDVITIMTTPAFYGAYKMIPFITLGYAFMGISNFLQACLMIKKRTCYIGIAVFISALCNIFLNFFLVPKFSIMGAAYATTVSFFIMFVFFYFFSQRTLSIKYEWIRLIKIILISMLIFYLSHLLKLPLIYSILFKFAVLLVFPILLFVVNFFTTEEMIYLKNIFERSAIVFVKRR